MKAMEALTRIFLVLAFAGSLVSPYCFAQASGPDDKAVPSAAAQPAPELKASKDKLSYALGMALGNQFRDRSIEVNLDLYVRGLKDAFSGGKTLLTEAEARAAVNTLQVDLKKKKAAPQGALTDMKISFKVDPRVTGGMYMGDRWISPPTFVQVGRPDAKEISVEARCGGTLLQRYRCRVVSLDNPFFNGVFYKVGGVLQIQFLEPGSTLFRIFQGSAGAAGRSF